eukprot:505006-Rhodomonas_salina.2
MKHNVEPALGEVCPALLLSGSALLVPVAFAPLQSRRKQLVQPRLRHSFAIACRVSAADEYTFEMFGKLLAIQLCSWCFERAIADSDTCRSAAPR